jgi:phosphocarrier protein FPr
MNEGEIPGTFALLAPLSGVVVPLDRVPDPVFAQRLAGDGVSIDPTSTILLAPCDGSVTQVHRAGHAVTLRTSHGLEILMHIGLDTVELGGSGFSPQVRPGQHVHTGQALIAFDADHVATHARSLLTQIIVTNMDRVAGLTVGAGLVTAGREVVLSVIPLDGPAADLPEPAGGEFLRSAPLVIAAGSGLHARPAAVVAARARGYAAEVRLVKNEHEANARSVVSIMALEVDGGDTVTVIARGEDAQAAIAAILDTLSGGNRDAPARPRAGDGVLPSPSPAEIAPEPPGLPRRIAEDRTSAKAGLPRRSTEDRTSAKAGLLHGVAASPGVAIGRIFQLRHEDRVVEEQAQDPSHERRALEAAIASADVQLEALQVRLTVEADADRAAIFAAHQALLEDPEILDAAAQRIRAGASAAYAWQRAYCAQAERLAALRNPLLAGRAADLADVGRRVLHLLPGREQAPPDFPADAIVVVEDLAPSDAASLDRARLRGFCMTLGSATSHAAILARALGIPAVAGIDRRALDVASGTRAMLDGTRGVLQLDPSEEEEVTAATRQRAGEDRRRTDLALAMSPAVTTDGHRIEVVANIGSEDESRQVPSSGGDGVGLLRTEFLFMERRTAPDEDEQTRAYEAIARALGPERRLVIRALDVGGDKPLSYLPIGPEPNPFLGERGIRLLLNRRDVLQAQVRAILRASRAGRIAVMFPMIATFAEWTAARDMVEAVRRDLDVPPIPVGIMVETAAAALLADVFAEQADFFSIGTNDLTQYTLAMDRSNPRLAPQIDGLHPAVLRLIDRTVAGAHARKRWVGVCGALAADPQAVPILIGLGIDELSVPVPALPAVKAQVRTLDLERCRALARQALAASDAIDVRALVPRGEER